MKKLFLLEDDLGLTSGLSSAVKKQGYEIDAARIILEADTLWADGSYDLVILDVSLPDGSDSDFCRKVRRTSKAPVMSLAAADEETDIIMGPDMGGGDYIAKLFELAVFLSGINVLLRESENFNIATAEVSSSGVYVQLLKGTIYRNGKQLDLTVSEYKSLCLLMEHPDQVLSPDQILSKLRDYNK